MNVALIGVLVLVVLWSGILGEESMTNAENWTRFDDLFAKYGKKYGVSAHWLKAIAMTESLLGQERSVKQGLADPNDIDGSKSSDGLSWGLMQITLTTAKSLDAYATPQKLNNAEYSIDLGARYIAWLKQRFSQTDSRYVEWVIKSYNQGPGRTLEEKTGKRFGAADEYYSRWKRNFAKITEGV